MNGQPNVDSIVSNSQMGFDHAGDASTMFFSKARRFTSLIKLSTHYYRIRAKPGKFSRLMTRKMST